MSCIDLEIPPRPYPTYDALHYSDFLRDHAKPNTPFLLSPKATESWPARQAWRLNDTQVASSSSHATSRPNLAALRAYADQVVPVANTSVRQFSEFERDERPLGEVLDLWESDQGESLYVKDWHLVAELEQRGESAETVYTPPPCFRDDWLSPPWGVDRGSGRASQSSASTADFRFVYAGPKGTFTPLHRDVFGSYSWSANVVGRKVWWLFPPGSEPRDRHGELLFDVRDDAGAVKIQQEEGEVIFVPSGWHHQVMNVDFCISINHNFFASPTLPKVYDALRVSEARCAESIEDVKADIKLRLGDQEEDAVPLWEIEWAAEVDGLLARDAGWGWEGFWSCVRDNLGRPPAEPSLSPPIEERAAYVKQVVDQYKASREWILLPEARQIVQQIEHILSIQHV